MGAEPARGGRGRRGYPRDPGPQLRWK